MENKGAKDQSAAAAQDGVDTSAGDRSRSQSQSRQLPKSILKNPLPVNSVNGVIPSTDGSTSKKSIDPLKSHSDADAEVQLRNTIVGEPSVAEKMSWAPQDLANVAGASKTQPSPDLSSSDFVPGTNQESSVSAVIPRSVSAVSKGESKEGSRDVVVAPPAKP